MSETEVNWGNRANETGEGDEEFYTDTGYRYPYRGED